LPVRRKKRGPKKWSTITVPVKVKKRIKQQAHALSKPMHFVISSFMQAPEYAEHRKSVSMDARFQTVAWHTFKLAFGIANIRTAVGKGEDPNPYAQKTLKTLQQIRQRFNVDTSYVAGILKQYLETKEKQDMLLLNEVAKELVKELMLKTHS